MPRRAAKKNKGETIAPPAGKKEKCVVKLTNTPKSAKAAGVKSEVPAGADKTPSKGAIPKNSSRKGNEDPVVDPKVDKNQPVYPLSAKKPFRVFHDLPCAIGCLNVPKDLLKQFPGTYLPQESVGGYNEHAVLHWCRALLEHDMFEQAHRLGAKSVVEMAGTVKRTSYLAKKLKMAFHSCNPIISSQDINRSLNIPKNLRNMVCENKVQECPELRNSDVLLSCHSAYYLDEVELLKVINKTRMQTGIMVFHSFVGREGSLPIGFPTEAKWNRDADGIHMFVYGNSFSYRHENDMSWLTQKAGMTFKDGGVDYTASYTLVKSVAGSHLYQISIKQGIIKVDDAEMEETPVNELSDSTMRTFNFSSWEREPGFLWILPRRGERVKIHYGLYEKLRLQMAGQFPSRSRYTTLANSARRIIVTEFQDISTEKWFLDSINLTIAIAYVEACVRQNEAQFFVSGYMPMLERSEYGVHVKRDDYGETYWGIAMSFAADKAKYLGLVEPLQRLDSAVTPIVHSVVMERLVDVVIIPLQVAKVVVERSVDLSISCAHDTAGFILPSVVEQVDSKLNAMVEKAKDQARLTEWLAGHPVRYEVDPVLVQGQLDKHVKTLKLVDVRSNRKIVKDTKDKDESLDLQSQLSFKKIYDITIDANVAKMARVPYIATAYHGASNAPSSGDATYHSAIMNRLFEGVEHSSALQVREWDKCLDYCEQLRCWPSEAFCTLKSELYPILEPQDWLDHQYGRRDDPKAYGRYKQAIDDLVDDASHRYFCNVFVKDENAANKGDNNKGRNIFAPNPRWVVKVASQVFSAQKTLAAWLNAKSSGDKPDSWVFFASGATNPDMVDWRTRVEEDLGERVFAIEIDMTKFEANQTQEQIKSSLERIGKLTNRDVDLLSLQLRLVVEQKTRKDRPKVVCERDGGNHSGVPNVTFTNTHNNLVVFVGYLVYAGFTVQEILDCVRAVLLGDDNLAYITLEHREKVSEAAIIKYYLDYHNWIVTVTIHESDKIDNAEFCSCIFQRVSRGGWVYTPKVGRLFAKTFFLPAGLPNRPTVVRGMICGLGQYQCGALLGSMLRILDNKMTIMGVAKPLKEIREDWSINALQASCDLNRQSDLMGDCMRYGLSEGDVKRFLDNFHKAVMASNFPYSPIVIPRSFVWDKVCDADYPREFCMDSGRVDLALRNRQLSVIAAYLFFVGVKGFKGKMRETRDSRLVVNFLGSREPDLGFLDGSV